MPNVTVGRDCHFYSEPHCPTDAQLKLQDAARGLAAYTLDGRLHVLHLGSGSDSVVGYADRARFMNAGLVYADGARINVISYSRLGPYGPWTIARSPFVSGAPVLAF
jgi:hypothetical protein